MATYSDVLCLKTENSHREKISEEHNYNKKTPKTAHVVNKTGLLFSITLHVSFMSPITCVVEVLPLLSLSLFPIA